MNLKDLLNLVHILDASGEFHEEKFFDTCLSFCEAGVYDDIPKDPYVNSRRGIKLMVGTGIKLKEFYLQ